LQQHNNNNNNNNKTKKENMHTERCGNTGRQKCCAKGSGKEVKIQEFMYRDRADVELKCTVIPVMIGATGRVTGSLRKHLEAVPGKQSIDSLQSTAVLGTAHIVRKVLQCEG
jgi:hypothetical protein